MDSLGLVHPKFEKLVHPNFEKLVHTNIEKLVHRNYGKFNLGRPNIFCTTQDAD